MASRTLRKSRRPVKLGRPAPALIAWTMWAAFLVCIAVSLVLRVPNRALADDPAGLVSLILAFGAFATVGAVVSSKRPKNAIGWIFSAIGLLAAVGGLVEQYSKYALSGRAEPLPLATLAAWIQGWYWNPLVGLALIYTPLLFPTGRPPSPRWRPLGWLAAGAVATSTLLGAVQEKIVLEEGGMTVVNPIGLSGVGDPERGPVGAVLSTVFVFCMIGAFFSMVVRFRRSTGDERQQIKWFAFAAGLVPLGLILDAAVPDDWMKTDLPFGLIVAALPVAAGSAVLKYRLYELDIVVNRTLVYASLTLGVIGFYMGVVAGSDALLRRSGLEVSLVATALVAVLFQPARERLQNSVDRMMYGERRDPYGVLSRLGKRLESLPDPQSVLPSVTQTVAEALRLPYAAIRINENGSPVEVASYGHPAGSELTVPLVYQGQRLGELVAGPRAPGEEFSAEDRRLLEDLARQVGVAAHSVRLTAELQLARQRLVTAREEERRRLRRDLHDGLGPTLAGIGLEIEAARNLLTQDLPGAHALLAKLAGRTQEATADIRRLVYGLRPPALDELGLIGALREHAARLAARPEGLYVSVNASAEVGSLPAAVEVAAYRIVLEALTNAQRHSGASAVSVRLERRIDTLEMEVNDDGKGLEPGYREGVGLASIRERAAELGGAFSIGPSASGKGTRLQAVLPIKDAPPG